jgi:thioredoxin reductase (NADPH)
VNLVTRDESLGRDMPRYEADRIERTARIRIWRNSEIVELIGESMLEKESRDRGPGRR